jgi:hypothetical protein
MIEGRRFASQRRGLECHGWENTKPNGESWAKSQKGNSRSLIIKGRHWERIFPLWKGVPSLWSRCGSTVPSALGDSNQVFNVYCNATQLRLVGMVSNKSVKVSGDERFSFSYGGSVIH